jgi:hypothetical protein
MHVDSFFSWNVQSHFLAFEGHGALFLITGVAGGWLVWKGRAELRPGSGRLLALWIVVPFLFSLFVWEPAWDHYHLQYLPALSILTAVLCQHLLAGGRPLMRLVAKAGLVWTLAIGPLLTIGMLQDYGRVRRLRDDFQVLLSYDPLLLFVAGIEPACGVTDPLAQFSRPFFQESPRFMRFVVSSDQVIACLEQAPGTRVLISNMQPTTLWFVDERLYAWLQRQTPPRALYLDERSRLALHATFAETHQDEIAAPRPR